MSKQKLVPGFRFHPTDVELVKYFLKRKVMGKKFSFEVITELDIYQYSPWDLPDKSCLRSGDLEWYFFSPRAKKYGSGSRTNRATKNGYWKATGKDRAVRHNKQSVGLIRTLVFHIGKAPDGDRTDWVMHEYRLEDKELTNKGIPQDSFVICKVFEKQGLGPRNGAQYGRPFNEQDWDDDDDDVQEEIPSAALSAPVPVLDMTSNNSSPENVQHLAATASGCIGPTSMLSCLSGPAPSPDPANPSDPTSNQAVNDDDNILTLLDLSKEDSKLPEMIYDRGQENIARGTPSSEFFEGLGDLDNWAALSGFFCGQNAEYSSHEMVTSGDLDYVELIDLDPPLFWQDYTS